MTSMYDLQTGTVQKQNACNYFIDKNINGFLLCLQMSLHLQMMTIVSSPWRISHRSTTDLFSRLLAFLLLNWREQAALYEQAY